MRAFVLLLLVACGSKTDDEAARRAVVEKEAAAVREAAQQREAADKARVDVAGTLAKLAREPDAQKPTSTKQDGDIERRAYAIAGFGAAELALVRKTGAWAWTLGEPTMPITAFGKLVDLMADAPKDIGGFPVGGVIQRIGDGPLEGAVVVDVAKSLVGQHIVIVTSVAYQQQTGSLMMSALCDLGAVAQVPAHTSAPFKEKCLAGVAKKVGKPVDTLFPKAWMLQVGRDKTCKHHLGGTVEQRTFSCDDDASGNLVVELR